MTLRRNLTALIASIFLCIGVFTPVVNAQQAGSGLQLSPTRSEITANAGEQKTFSIMLKNITPGELTAKAELNDFESDNTTGNPKIIVDATQRTPYSLSSMLQGLKNVDLKPGETKELKFTVNVPGNASPGAYYGAVRYSVVPKGTSSAERQIALNASVAHLVFVEVPGNVVQQIKVESLKVQKKNGKPGTFFFSKPEEAALAVHNMGNGFSRPFGRVVIKNGFGKEVHSYDVNNGEQRGLVLPNSSRTFVNEIGGIKIPGKYSATASVAYGNGGEVVNFKSTFWYMPVWFIIALFVFVLVIAGGVFFLYKKRFSRGAANKRRRQ